MWQQRSKAYSEEQRAKTLNGMCGCAGLSETSLGAYTKFVGHAVPRPNIKTHAWRVPWGKCPYAICGSDNQDKPAHPRNQMRNLLSAFD